MLISKVHNIATSATQFKDNMPSNSRRDFLKLGTTALLTASGLIGLGGLIRFLDFQTDPAPKTEFDLGLASNFPTGSRKLIPEVPALLIHNQNGFSALSLVCTHLGCTVQEKPEGFTCPCHGSRYDENGKVLRGPAQNPLKLLNIETTSNGHLILHNG
jgi:cytochrome b6-f complex iron-sulfur subunit